MGAKLRLTSHRAKHLRQNETYTERKLWGILKNRGYENLKFRRRYPIHPYIVDFYCHKLRLIIELDGISHDSLEKKKYDEARDQFLLNNGYQVIRVSDEDFIKKPHILFNEIDSVVIAVKSES